MTRLRTTAFMLIATLLGTSACSLANRDGPNVTCADLHGGQVNACADGIIAACSGGAVQWHVCDDKSVCSAAWQTHGAFQCEQGDAGHPPDAGSGDTGTPDTGSDTPPPCGPTDVCPVVSVAGNITAFAVDSTGLFVTDDSSVWTTPPAGGFTTTLATSSRAQSFGYMFLDAANVYVLRYDEGRIARVAKSGGSFATVATFTYAQSFAADTNRIYWCEGASTGPIRAQVKTGGSPVTIVSNTNCRPLSVGPGFLYWPGSAGIINRVPTSATGPTPPSTISVTASIGTTSVTSVSADDSGIYFSGGSPASIWKIPTGSATAVKLADGVGAYGYIGLSASNVFWVNWEGGFGVVKKAAKDGSSGATAIFQINDTSINDTRIVTNGTYAYWKAGHSLYRAPQ